MESDELAPACEKCGAAVLLSWQEGVSVSRKQVDELPAGVWRYRGFFSGVDYEHTVTLGEGGTPLLRAERLGIELGLRRLLIKDETRNPTGSFMDRGSTVLLTAAKGRGVKECTCVTTGNLGASLSAYCAKAGIDARVKVHPNTDQGKLYQMLAYGAEIETQQTRPRTRSSLEVTAGNPFLLEGEKTTGFEVAHDLDWAPPDAIVVPVGTGGHLSMIWHAITQLREAGFIDRTECRLIGVQVEGQSSPARGARSAAPPTWQGTPLAELEESEPYFRKEAASAMRDSGGFVLTTTSPETIRATGLLARTEGIFAEPASSSVVAALAEAARGGQIRAGETVVCVITGAGLKDTRAISRLARETRRPGGTAWYSPPGTQIGATKAAILRLLSAKPNYGYELWLRLGAERKISTASVYQHLNELDSYGMVRRRGSVTSGGRERVLYELTKKGADFLSIAGRLERAGRSTRS